MADIAILCHTQQMQWYRNRRQFLSTDSDSGFTGFSPSPWISDSMNPIQFLKTDSSESHDLDSVFMNPTK